MKKIGRGLSSEAVDFAKRVVGWIPEGLGTDVILNGLILATVTIAMNLRGHVDEDSVVATTREAFAAAAATKARVM